MRCLIVDDSAVFVHAACRLLEHQGIAVVGAASTSEEAMGRFEELTPDLALVDVELGDENGFDVVKQMAATGSPASAILISSHTADEFADMIAASPAAGFICKSDLTVDAIMAVVDGFAEKAPADQR